MIRLRGDVENVVATLQKFTQVELFMNYVEESDATSIEPGESSPPIDSSIYITSTDHIALETLFRYWQWYSNDRELIYGSAALRDLFPCIEEIRYWNHEDRLNQTDVREYFNEQLATDHRLIAFELELWFRRNSGKRNAVEQYWELIVAQLGGEIVARSCIPEICYHALLLRVPADAVREILDSPQLSAIASNATVQSLHDVGQAIHRSSDEESDWDVDPTTVETVTLRPPVCAIFDTVIVANHPALAKHVQVLDPEDWSSVVPVNAREHGTAMASLVIHGDLKENLSPIDRSILSVPILKPAGNNPQAFPDDRLMLDVLHQRVREMMDSVVGDKVRVISLSIGDMRTKLDRNMSKLGRLLDFLSWKYSILFIVSAGNVACNFTLPDEHRFAEAHEDVLLEASIVSSVKGRASRRIISPADSMNALTIGSIYDDGDNDQVPPNLRLLSTRRFIPAPYSREGRGFRKSIKPDLAIAGGRIAFRESLRQNVINEVRSGKPGQRVAHPNGLYTNSRGTSNSAALLTRYANIGASIVDDLEIERGFSIPEDSRAVLLKALLAHAATRDPVQSALEAHGLSPEQATRITELSVGYGAFDRDAFAKCSNERAILIGIGRLKKDGAHDYTIPMPAEVVGTTARRRISLTLAYFSPINSQHQLYRKAKLSLTVRAQHLREVSGVGAALIGRDLAARGTLQQLKFEGADAVATADETLIARISCRSDAGADLQEEIPYALVASLDADADANINVYEHVVTVLERLRVVAEAASPTA